MAERRSLRWWPAILIVTLAVLTVAWLWLFNERSGQDRFVYSAVVVVVALLLLLLWVILFSRMSWKLRLLILALVVLGAYGSARMLQFRGVTGDLVPIFSWRWAADEKMPAAPKDWQPEGAAPSIPEALAEVSLPLAADYPQFLGPSRNATVAGIQLARDWAAQPPRELWRQPVGEGWSGFAVAGSFAVTQEQRGPEELVVAYDLASGTERWTHTDLARYETTLAGVGPRATPTIVGGRVYTMGATGILNALELATGRRIWTRNVLLDNQARNPEWGKSCSPLVVGGLVIVSAGGTGGRSLVAYDRANGQIAWRDGSDTSGYSSPLLTTLSGIEQVLIFNNASIAAHDRVTGEVLWTFPWPSQQPNVAQPLPLPGDRLLVSSGYGIGSKLLRIRKMGNTGVEPTLLWESPRLKAKFTNVVYHQGFVYGLDDGTLVCLDPETGERRWKRGRYGHGQVILVDDLLLIQTEHGDVVLVEVSPEKPVELGRLSAFEGKTWNSPALAGRYLLVRNDRQAACFELPLAG